MAGPNDFTNQNIQDTYQRVLQTDGQNIFDGTGSAFNLTNDISITASHAQQAVTASHALFAISASHEITHELSTSYSQTADSASNDFNINNNLNFITDNPNFNVAGTNMIGLSAGAGQIRTFQNIRTSNNRGINFGTNTDYGITHNNSATTLLFKEGNSTRLTMGVGGHFTGSSGVNFRLLGSGKFIGDFAEITNITGSHISASTEFYTDGHVTASGNISASGYVLTNELRGSGDDVSLNVLGSITASTDISADGNISASGAIIGDSINVLSDSAATGYKLYQPGPAGTLQLSDASGGGFTKFYVKSTTTEVLGLEVGSNATIGPAPTGGQPSTGTVTINSIINNNVTASGNISASDHIYASRYYADGDIVLDTSGTKTVLAGDGGTTGVQFGKHDGVVRSYNFDGHITASGNISASSFIISGSNGSVLMKTIVGHDGIGNGKLFIQPEAVNESLVQEAIDQGVYSLFIASSSGNTRQLIYSDTGHSELQFRASQGGNGLITFNENGDTRYLIGTDGSTDSFQIRDSNFMSGGSSLLRIHTGSGFDAGISFGPTGSGDLSRGYFHITASGNISASGIGTFNRLIVDPAAAGGSVSISNQGVIVKETDSNLTAAHLYSNTQIGILDLNYAGGNTNGIQLAAAGDCFINPIAGGLMVGANGNASSPDMPDNTMLFVHGNISSSGVLYTNHISTGSGELAKNYISITGSTSVFGNVTSSGNISISESLTFGAAASEITFPTELTIGVEGGNDYIRLVDNKIELRAGNSVAIEVNDTSNKISLGYAGIDEVTIGSSGTTAVKHNFATSNEPLHSQFGQTKMGKSGDLGSTSTATLFITGSGHADYAGTALEVEGNISASGVLYVDHISTGSGELAENYISITGSTSVFGNVTASGNMSVGGNVNLPNTKAFTIDDTGGTPMNVANINGANVLTFGDNARIAHVDGTVVSLDSEGSIFLDSDSGDIQVQDNGVTSITLNSTDGHISASGNITATDLSASGVVYTNHISTGSGELAENYISITGSTSVFGNVTASANIIADGNISASGQVYSDNIETFHGSARITSVAVNNYSGPNFQGIMRHEWTRKLAETVNDNNTIQLNRQDVRTGIIIPYAFKITGFTMFYGVNKNGTQTIPQGALFALTQDEMDLNDNVNTADTNTLTAICTGLGQGTKGYNTHLCTGSCDVNMPAGSSIYYRVKPTTTVDGTTIDMNYTIQWKRIKE